MQTAGLQWRHHNVDRENYTHLDVQLVTDKNW